MYNSLLSCLETATWQKAKKIIELILFASFFLGFTDQCCLLSNVWKELFHIFCHFLIIYSRRIIFIVFPWYFCFLLTTFKNYFILPFVGAVKFSFFIILLYWFRKWLFFSSGYSWIGFFQQGFVDQGCHTYYTGCVLSNSRENHLYVLGVMQRYRWYTLGSLYSWSIFIFPYCWMIVFLDIKFYVQSYFPSVI